MWLGIRFEVSMEVRADVRFDRDLKRIRNANLLSRVERVVEDLKKASAIFQVPGIVRMTARGNFYRIRVGDYRIGVEVEGGVVTLLRFAHRSEIYRRFP